METESMAASTKAPQLSEIRNAKFCSQPFITYHPIGIAISKARATRTKKYRKNKMLMFATEAPNTFLIPTSLVRFDIKNETKPNNPRQEMKIDSPATTLYSFESCSSC